MAAKSVVQVEIQDDQFRDFYALFQEYQAKLETMPDDWKATGEAIEGAGGDMEVFSEASRASKDFLLIAATQAGVISKEIRAASVSNNALLESLTKNTKAQKDFADETERGNQSLKKMKDSAEGVASSIFGIGKFLMKVGAWGAGLAGLGGLLGGLGLKDLAESAVDNQRSARGLGMTPGQLTAFNQDYGRYIDQGTVGSVANAQNSFSGRMWLARAAGEGINQVASQDPGQLAGQLAIRAHDWWANTPENMRTAENLQSSGFTQSGFSLAMMRQYGNTPLSELQRAGSQYQQDQDKFNVGDKNTDAWYGFLRQIKDAGNTIEKDLTNRLAVLAPDLQHFVDVMGKDAKKLIDEIFTPSNLQSIEDGIDHFADYLGSDGFKEDMKDFADLVSGVVGALRKTAKFLNIEGSSDTPDKTLSTMVPAGTGLDPDEVQRETHGQVRNFGGLSNLEIGMGRARHFLNMPGNPGALLASIDKKNGLPAGTLEGMWERESTKGNNLVGPVLKNGDQALGDFQFTSAAWKDWGNGGDRFSFIDEANAAGSFMASNQKRYGGNIRKSLAAYNYGPGNVNPNDAGWESKLPPETRNYESQIGAQIAKLASAIDRLRQSPKGVQITNNTSARVAVQANAAAAQ